MLQRKINSFVKQSSIQFYDKNYVTDGYIVIKVTLYLKI